jgi:hypothetical protein
MNQTSDAMSQRRKPITLAQTAGLLAVLTLWTALAPSAAASENVPHRPYAMWADLPEAGQFVVGLVYEESEAYRIWAGTDQHSVKYHSGGEDYGIDVNQGYFALQYGITAKWAADLNIGATTVGWRFFSNGHIEDTTGLMDTSFGVRYQVFNETNAPAAWLPTLTLRAGAVLPGTYDESIAFAPGFRSAAIEPEVLFRKHFGWTGFGCYGDALFRWNRTTGNDQYMTVIGLFQQIKGWELDAGYRHLQTISGEDIVLFPDNSIYYPRQVREINDSVEAGFSYTTSKRHIRYGFNSRVVFDGSNTDRAFWVGGSVDIPIGGQHGLWARP